MADRKKDKKEKSPVDDYDFFAPHPHPTKVRVKQSFFDHVPDAYEGKSIAFNESPKRSPKKAAEEAKAEETSKKEEETPADSPEDKTPVQETIGTPISMDTVAADPWDTRDSVSRKSSTLLSDMSVNTVLISIYFFLSVISEFVIYWV